MASPQRVGPDDPRYQSDNPQSRRLEKTPERRRRVWYWWWGFWIVIFAAAIGWGIWGAVGGNGWWFLGRPNPSNVKGPPMNGQGVAALQSPNKQAFVGQKFQANFVPVQKKISDTVFWVGAKNSTPMLLVIKNSDAANRNGPSKKVNLTIEKGNLIDITGTVEKAPPQAQAQQQWKLSSSDAARLAREGGYIDATLAYYVPR
ncbi:MAG TPA: hypothetical protein VF730_02370 [Terracidiphilus sp.]